MGRPSKLSEEKWGDLLRRLASGEKAADLARIYKVSPTSVSKRVSQQAKRVESLAHTVIQVQAEIEALPIPQQKAIRSLIEDLRALGTSSVRVAALNSEAAEIVAIKGLQAARALPNNPTVEDYRPVAAAAETTNKLTDLGAKLLSVNKAKDVDPPPADDLKSLPTATLLERVDKIRAAL